VGLPSLVHNRTEFQRRPIKAQELAWPIVVSQHTEIFAIGYDGIEVVHVTVARGRVG
jgi:hypothetical protein